MESLFEQLGGTYARQGDYCLPDVCLPPEEERPIGIYGQRRRTFLKAHHRVLYYNLLTAGVLDGHLADIEEQAQELFLRLVEQYADAEGVTERLKASEPQSWVRKMNGIRNRANEAVMQEIVYGIRRRRRSLCVSASGLLRLVGAGEQIDLHRNGELLIKSGVAGVGAQTLMQLVEAVAHRVFVAVDPLRRPPDIPLLRDKGDGGVQKLVAAVPVLQ